MYVMYSHHVSSSPLRAHTAIFIMPKKRKIEQLHLFRSPRPDEKVSQLISLWCTKHLIDVI